MNKFNFYLEIYSRAFKKEYGEKLFREIEAKIINSAKVHKLVNLTKLHKSPPLYGDYIDALNEIPFFIFSKKHTIGMGSIIALSEWNKIINSDQEFLTESEVIDVFFKIAGNTNTSDLVN